MVVSPTNLKPSFRSAFDIAWDSGVLLWMSRWFFGALECVLDDTIDWFSGQKLQKNFANDIPSYCICRLALAFWIVASILPLCLTMPALLSRRSISLLLNFATNSGSKFLNAILNSGRLRKIVSQLKPDWKPSRQIFSKMSLSSITGLPNDSRSLTFRLCLQASDRTLTDAEVTAIRQKCLNAAAKLGALLRN